MPARFGPLSGALVLALAGAASAQEAPPGPPLVAPAERPASPVVTLDQERLFLESAWGRATMARIEAAKQVLSDENRQIEAQLEAEEQALTAQRPTMAPAEFSKLADDFDARVERIRTEQEDKARDLARQVETDRGLFYEAAVPVLADLMQEVGAVAILSDGAVFLSLSSLDVTDRAILLVDARLTPPAAPAPAPLPEAAPAEAAPPEAAPNEADPKEPQPGTP